MTVKPFSFSSKPLHFTVSVGSIFASSLEAPGVLSDSSRETEGSESPSGRIRAQEPWTWWRVVNEILRTVLNNHVTKKHQVWGLDEVLGNLLCSRPGQKDLSSAGCK